MSQNNPPFAIGQKVVCIDDSRSYGVPHDFIKGESYIISDIDYFHKCNGDKWGVKINGFCLWYNSTRFAPIQSNYSDATAEILEKFKSPAETPDKVIVPEKVKQ